MSRADYPDNWSEIRARILKRATDENGIQRCEWCGAENHQWIWYHPAAVDYPEMAHVWTQDERQAVLWYGSEAVSGHESSVGYLVVLTTAHIHNPDPMDCRDENLAALCQTCHNRHDIRMRHMNIVRRKHAEAEAAGQLRLF